MTYSRQLKMLAFCLVTSLCRPVVAANEWHVVERPGDALTYYRSSHTTAMAGLVKYHAVSAGSEPAHALISICWLYARQCECGRPDKPIVWQVAQGLSSLFAGRGYPNTPVKELARYARSDAEVAEWARYTEAIDGSRPVILTFCYDASAKGDLAQARRRVSDCTSVLGIGYVTHNGKHYLICHDGIPPGQSHPASVDRVSPASIGLSAGSGVWSQAGTSIYRWDGAYTNLVMVFTGKPTK